MTTNEARRLLVGTVVMWNGDPTDLGTVRKLRRGDFLVDWARGTFTTGWFRYSEAQEIKIR